MSGSLPHLEHLLTLSDDVGLIQHATESIPNRSTGYCTDDVARALIVALQRLRVLPDDEVAMRLAAVYLAFLADAQLPDGRFHNFMSYQREWLDEVGTHDSCGRAMWALGYAARYAPRSDWRRICAAMLERSLASIDWLQFPRSQAYAMLGLAHMVQAEPDPGARGALQQLSDALISCYLAARNDAWEWFEPFMTYDNARLCEALIRAGMALREPHAREAGLRTLGFLEEVVFEGGVFVPIGNDGWYQRGGLRARFAQQPLEAAAMVDAEIAAFDASGEAERLSGAKCAAAWYDGKNLLGVVMANGGGCYDGLEEGGPNRNMGAESTLSYLSASYSLAIATPERPKDPIGKTASGGESILDDNPGVRGT